MSFGACCWAGMRRWARTDRTEDRGASSCKGNVVGPSLLGASGCTAWRLLVEEVCSLPVHACLAIAPVGKCRDEADEGSTAVGLPGERGMSVALASSAGEVAMLCYADLRGSIVP
jgi:hypothetical protein